jgi:hypothetical protein
VFTTRIVANLDLPLEWARAPTEHHSTKFGLSPEAFAVAAQSYDRLLAVGAAYGGPTTERRSRGSVFVAGSIGSPFLVRKCLLAELAGQIMPSVFNHPSTTNHTLQVPSRTTDSEDNTDAASPLDAMKTEPPGAELPSTVPSLSLKTISLNYAIQRGQARLPCAPHRTSILPLSWPVLRHCNPGVNMWY